MHSVILMRLHACHSKGQDLSGVVLSDFFSVEAELKSVRAAPHNLSPELLDWLIGETETVPGNLPAQDLWGTGCMLAELLLGSHPFYASAEAQDSVAVCSAYQRCLDRCAKGNSGNWGLDLDDLASNADDQWSEWSSTTGSELQRGSSTSCKAQSSSNAHSSSTTKSELQRDNSIGSKAQSSSNVDQMEEEQCVDHQEQLLTGPSSTHSGSSSPLDVVYVSAWEQHRRWVCPHICHCSQRCARS